MATAAAAAVYSSVFLRVVHVPRHLVGAGELRELTVVSLLLLLQRELKAKVKENIKGRGMMMNVEMKRREREG